MKTEVTTSYTTGTTIRLGACEAANFLIGIAISVVAQCREMVSVENMGILESTTNIPQYDCLIDEYCDGVHGAILSNILLQNVEVLYSFVQDCVLNETIRGLYLLRKTTRNGKAAYKLITFALKEYMELLERDLSAFGKEIPRNAERYDKYNWQFEGMFEVEE